MARTSSAITTSGGLLPSDLLACLASKPESLDGTRPEDYHLPAGRRLRDAISRGWSELLGQWADFRDRLDQLPEGDRATTVTRETWLLPLLTELGFGRLAPARGGLSADGASYPISHAWGAVPIHLLGADIDLDRSARGVAGAARSSPHALVQDFLNRSDDHLWGIVSNGCVLRLLRDHTSLTRPAYVEFDLQAIFEAQSFADFAVLWLLCHQSRFEADRPEDCWLERWAADARQMGIRALANLRDGFEAAIRCLGAGFLAHPANGELRRHLYDGDLRADDYHRQILRLVYRLVFLLVAEDRHLLLRDPDSSEARLYHQHYSVGRVRDAAARGSTSQHSDLWESFRPVFQALGGAGAPLIGLPPLGSYLWSPAACPDLDGACLANSDLFGALTALAFVDRDKARQRVDFAHLGSEELGSVYESLLELRPRLDTDAGTFVLVTTVGHERKTTGSYYTPTTLVAELLDDVLEPVLDAAVRAPDPEGALLSVSVLDPACGSGHFLIAAAERIARRLASVRTGEIAPPPGAISHALRDVVSRCMYGIDLNPMAVELCKVNLWMEAVDPGRPLSFLDHHIVVGNALLGTSPENLSGGIPDRAFKPVAGDSKGTARSLRDRNIIERRGQGSLFAADVTAITTDVADLVSALSRVADDTVDSLAEKTERWRKLLLSDQYERAVLACDAWCAAFLHAKTTGSASITDSTISAIVADPASIGEETREAIASVHEIYRPLHPHLVFSEVFARGGFDVVLGNPPWLSYSGRQKVAIDEHELNLLGFLYPEISSWPSSHSAFMIRAQELLKSGGRVGLVAPLQVFHLERYGGLRERIAREAEVVVTDVGEDAFEGVSQRVGLYAMHRVVESDTAVPWEFLGQSPLKPHSPNATSADEQDEVLDQLISILHELPAFPSEAFADPGVHTGNVSKLIVSDTFPDNDPKYQPVREGRDLTAFYCGQPKKRLWVEPVLNADQYCTIRPRDVYVSTPVLLRQTADRPIACRHVERTYFRNSVLACRGVPGVADEVIVAVLNSELIRQWYRADVQESGQRAFPQVKVRNLRRLPMFPTPTSDRIIDELTRLVTAIEQQAPSVIEIGLRQEVEAIVCDLYRLPKELTEWLVDAVSGVAHPSDSE